MVLGTAVPGQLAELASGPAAREGQGPTGTWHPPLTVTGGDNGAGCGAREPPDARPHPLRCRLMAACRAGRSGHGDPSGEAADGRSFRNEYFICAASGLENQRHPARESTAAALVALSEIALSGTRCWASRVHDAEAVRCLHCGSSPSSCATSCHTRPRAMPKIPCPPVSRSTTSSGDVHSYTLTPSLISVTWARSSVPWLRRC